MASEVALGKKPWEASDTHICSGRTGNAVQKAEETTGMGLDLGSGSHEVDISGQDRSQAIDSFCKWTS